MLVGDLNAQDSETCLSNSLFEPKVKNVVNNYKCYKNVKNPRCIDLAIENSPMSFQNTVTMTTGLF